MTQTQQQIVDIIIELGVEHKAAVREKTALQNMLKARARTYVGFEALKSNKGEKIDKAKASAVYKRLIDEGKDPLFLNRVRRIYEPFKQAAADQKQLADAMGNELRKLPISKWVEHEDQKGFGHNGVAKLVAEAGRDLNDYHSPAKFWKRYGEHVVDGKAPKLKKGKQLGFSPYRRSVSYQIGDSALKAGGTKEKDNLSFWKKVYEARKEYEIKRAEAAGLTIVPEAKMPPKDSEKRKKYMSEGHIHNRAAKYMRKKFLEALWQEWTGNKRDMELPEFLSKAA